MGKQVHCDYCGRRGHTKDTCFQLHPKSESKTEEAKKKPYFHQKRTTFKNNQNTFLQSKSVIFC